MELDRRLQLELKRKLFASRENNSKIEKTFVNDLGNQFQGQSPVAVQGGCDLIASNYYHPNGHTMPFLIGLEYATYRYLKLPAKYASHYSFISKPAECAVCFTDFTIQWIEDDQGRILCNDCAVRPVKKKIKKESQKQLKRTIISCFTKEYGNISKTYERRRKRKENVDPCDNETSPTKSQDQSKRTDEIEAASESIKESKSDEKCRNSSGDITLADEKNQNAGDKKEPVTEPASEVSNESENAEHEIPPKEINEPMETDNKDDDGGSILDQLSQDDDQGDSENDNKK